MLTGLTIAIIGGDARQLEIIRKLTEQQANIYLVGFDQLDHGFTGAVKCKIDEIAFQQIDSIILPVSATTGEGVVATVFSNEEVVLKQEHLEQTPAHCVIYSGISNTYLEKIATEANRKLVKLFERDDIAIFNSIPTVEGTIMMAIQHTDYTIHGSRVAVLGLGRTGMTIARTFAALGAKVKVGARSSAHLARISEMGLVPFQIDELTENVKDIDICINTVPSMVLNQAVLSRMTPKTLILDLASRPGGTDFKYAEKQGIKALLAPGLPGIVAPKTAGQILANVLSKLLSELQVGEEK
ncbi:dipicolinic acid synthetase subunit A [Bacillus atrophaeus]|uniref:dipicolinic acid synthetase subunit A n=1 Tax=Bacillus atrophaeus TaxID=1452 RepID=UPI000D026EC2|nr:dipicolinic acid synthetase subunit A [Bacillus atrophaeus]MCY8909037.1 dipicolinic acid synthetase subunit A [Bacillus atrophaeus]MEC0838584.1 dipicolinic acid synthetase subunit A [Bacillus atrophaeus]MEC0847527.1 dipicolinic acid synthetase subunit A [Bacillus atrophaeus]MEC0848606.1 dipicolinic acid synthetase subunit A [Bacillus atrophaeus]MEC0866968.1 dipicolinic acid synthetase subunit A [Bacillus atrophaeus]